MLDVIYLIVLNEKHWICAPDDLKTKITRLQKCICGKCLIENHSQRAILKSFHKAYKTHSQTTQHELQCCINTCSSLMEYSLAE